MDLQKVATYTTAAAVVGTGGVVGGGKIIDVQTGGPEKRMQAAATELRLIVREEVQRAMWDAWPEKTGGVKGLNKDPGKDYRQQTPPRQ